MRLKQYLSSMVPALALLTMAFGNHQALAAESDLELVTPGSLTIGFNPTPGIFEVGESGEVSGIYGKLITEVAKRLNLKPVYVPLAFPALIPAVQSHRVDVNSG